MRLGIIGWDHEEPASLSLVRYGQKLGHEVTLFTLSDVQLRVGGAGLSRVFVNNVPVDSFDAIVSRAQLRDASWREDFERLMAVQQAFPGLVDPATTFAVGESKLLAMQRLAAAGLPVPPTSVCTSVTAVHEAWRAHGRIVAKPSFGYGGEDVERVMNDFETMAPRIEELIRKHGALLVQEFIPHPHGDIRATVIGDEIVFGVRRIPNRETWKANITLGADWVPYQPSPAVRELSMAAARCMGITIAGLDILESNGRFFILEVNNVPGWGFLDEGDVEVVCGKVIAHALRTASTASGRSRGPCTARPSGARTDDWVDGRMTTTCRAHEDAERTAPSSTFRLDWRLAESDKEYRP
jgi:ribosomal protein S6--L-glutamate ligase